MFKKRLSSLALTGSLVLGFSGYASAASYVVTPTYNSSSEMYVVPYQARGEIYHSINVDKYGDSNDRITAKYWVDHTKSSKNRVGVVTAYRTNKMSIYGYWSPDLKYQMDDMRIQTVGDGYTKEIRAFKDTDSSNFGAFGFVYNINQPLEFEHVNMSGGPWHSIASYMIGDYSPVWNDDHTKVNGFHVQPNPGLTSLNATSEKYITGEPPKTNWTLITVDDIKNSKEIRDKANNIKLELVNGADKSILKEISLAEYLLNQDKYNELMEKAHKEKLNSLN